MWQQYNSWQYNGRLIWWALMAANSDIGQIRLPCSRGRYFVCTSLDDLTFSISFDIFNYQPLLKASSPTHTLFIISSKQLPEFANMTDYHEIFKTNNWSFSWVAFMQSQNYVSHLIINYVTIDKSHLIRNLNFTLHRITYMHLYISFLYNIV